MMHNGKVLFCTAGAYLKNPISFYEYDPATNVFTKLANPPTAI